MIGDINELERCKDCGDTFEHIDDDSDIPEYRCARCQAKFRIAESNGEVPPQLSRWKNRLIDILRIKQINFNSMKGLK
mgnify:CR=1 FL=1